MPQTFISLPNGSPGASVTLPVSLATKTFYPSGTFDADKVILEVSPDDVSYTVAAFVDLDNREPVPVSFSAAYARIRILGLRSGTPVCFLAVNAVGGVRGNVPLTVPAQGAGPLATVSDLPKDKTFIITTSGQSVDCLAQVEVSLDDVNFNPLFKIEGRLFTLGDAVRVTGLFKSARVNVIRGIGTGMSIAAVSDPECCGPPPVELLSVTDIDFNIDDDELEPGYPDASTWCSDQSTNPPLISITFSLAVDPSTVTGSTVQLLDNSSNPVAIGSFSFSVGNTVVSFSPSAPLALGNYSISVSAGVETPSGTPCTPVSFDVEAENCAPVIGCSPPVYAGTEPLGQWNIGPSLSDPDNTVLATGLTRRLSDGQYRLVLNIQGASGPVPTDAFIWDGGALSLTRDATYPSPSPGIAATNGRFNGTFSNCGLFCTRNGFGEAPAPMQATSYVPASDSWVNTTNVNLLTRVYNVVVLDDDRVFMTGEGAFETCIYEPGTGNFVSTATVPVGITLYDALVVKLADGRVLVAGGVNFNTSTSNNAAAIYNPNTNSWTVVASMNTARAFNWISQAVRMVDGRVLAAGGYEYSTNIYTNTCEIYDPVANTWTPTGSMLAGWPSFGAGFVALPSNKAVVAGGADNALSTPIAQTQIYDANTGLWTLGPNLNQARSMHTMMLAPDLSQYTVVVAGGFGGAGPGFLVSTEYLTPSP